MDCKRIDVVLEEMARLKHAIAALEDNNERPNPNCKYWDPKRTGQVKRASLDLTRALAELRKP